MSRLKGAFFKSSPALRGVLILNTISALLLTQLALAADHASDLPPEKHTLILDQAIQFKPESYTDGTPKDLNKALNEYKQKKEQQAKQIQIDLKGALAEIDKPIANNLGCHN